jgi:hypothetical protein
MGSMGSLGSLWACRFPPRSPVESIWRQFDTRNNQLVSVGSLQGPEIQSNHSMSAPRCWWTARRDWPGQHSASFLPRPPQNEPKFINGPRRIPYHPHPPWLSGTLSLPSPFPHANPEQRNTTSGDSTPQNNRTQEEAHWKLQGHNRLQIASNPVIRLRKKSHYNPADSSNRAEGLGGISNK